MVKSKSRTGQQHNFAVRVAGQTELDGVAPLIEREGPRDREIEEAPCGEVCVLRKEVAQRGRSSSQLVDVDAGTKPAGFVVVADRHHSPRVAAGKGDEVGKGARAGASRVEHEVDVLTVGQGPHSLDHAIAVAGDAIFEYAGRAWGGTSAAELKTLITRAEGELRALDW
jgi:hypothetical protein